MMSGVSVPALPLSIALLGAPGAGLRAQLEWAATCGVRAVQLNAAAPDARPRDLGRSARRDLASLLRRLELQVSGLDLFIPPRHLADPATADRAASAVLDAIDFAAELVELAGGQRTLSLELPTIDELSGSGVVRSLADRASSRAVRLADHRWPPTWGKDADPDSSPLGVGIDPGALMPGGVDPPAQVSGLGRRLASARLSDADAAGRTELGRGRLDVLAYTVALLTAGYNGFGIIDLRTLPDPDRAVRGVRGAIDRVTPGLPPVP